ncbi:MAG: hypothetical protein ISS78_03360 [Phycisphaerae bacterium]|nr:hypothetical protein [Phycisphaerae bacterium]
MIAALFVNPIAIPFKYQLWLMLPLCAAVATVYKTIRTTNVRRLHIEILALLAYMVAGLVALGTALWAIHTYWP